MRRGFRTLTDDSADSESIKRSRTSSTPYYGRARYRDRSVDYGGADHYRKSSRERRPFHFHDDAYQSEDDESEVELEIGEELRGRGSQSSSSRSTFRSSSRSRPGYRPRSRSRSLTRSNSPRYLPPKDRRNRHNSSRYVDAEEAGWEDEGYSSDNSIDPPRRSHGNSPSAQRALRRANAFDELMDELGYAHVDNEEAEWEDEGYASDDSVDRPRQNRSTLPSGHRATRASKAFDELMDELGYAPVEDDDGDADHVIDVVKARDGRCNSRTSTPEAFETTDTYRSNPNLPNYPGGSYPNRGMPTRSRSSSTATSFPTTKPSRVRARPSILRKQDPSKSEYTLHRRAEWRYDPGHTVAFELIRQNNYWKKHELAPGKEDDNLPQFAPSHLPDLDVAIIRNADSILETAGILSAPTTTHTMEDTFEKMYELGLNGSNWNPDSEAIRSACDRKGFTASDRLQLRDELELFGESGFTHISDAYSVNCEDITARGAASFWDKEDPNRKHAAASMLQAWVEGRTFILDTVKDRRRYLDAGGQGIDLSPDVSQIADDTWDTVEDRDYSTDKYTVQTDLSLEAIEGKRERCRQVYRETWDKVEQDLVEQENELAAPLPVPSARSDQCYRFLKSFEDELYDVQQEQHYSRMVYLDFLANDKQNLIRDKETLYSKLSTFEPMFNVQRQNMHLEKLFKSIAADKYCSMEEWAERFPELSESKKWSDALTKSEGRGGDPEYKWRWWRSHCIANRFGKTHTLLKNPITLTGSIDDKFATMMEHSKSLKEYSSNNSGYMPGLVRRAMKREEAAVLQAKELEEFIHKLSSRK